MAGLVVSAARGDVPRVRQALRRACGGRSRLPSRVEERLGTHAPSGLPACRAALVAAAANDHPAVVALLDSEGLSAAPSIEFVLRWSDDHSCWLPHAPLDGGGHGGVLGADTALGVPLALRALRSVPATAAACAVLALAASHPVAAAAVAAVASRAVAARRAAAALARAAAAVPSALLWLPRKRPSAPTAYAAAVACGAGHETLLAAAAALEPAGAAQPLEGEAVLQALALSPDPGAVLRPYLASGRFPAAAACGTGPVLVACANDLDDALHELEAAGADTDARTTAPAAWVRLANGRWVPRTLLEHMHGGGGRGGAALLAHRAASGAAAWAEAAAAMWPVCLALAFALWRALPWAAGAGAAARWWAAPACGAAAAWLARTRRPRRRLRVAVALSAAFASAREARSGTAREAQRRLRVAAMPWRWSWLPWLRRRGRRGHRPPARRVACLGGAAALLLWLVPPLLTAALLAAWAVAFRAVVDHFAAPIARGLSVVAEGSRVTVPAGLTALEVARFFAAKDCERDLAASESDDDDDKSSGSSSEEWSDSGASATSGGTSSASDQGASDDELQFLAADALEHLALRPNAGLARLRPRRSPRGAGAASGMPQCVVCGDRERQEACLPCGHCVMCSGCAAEFRRRTAAGARRCPVCRRSVLGYRRVYLG